MKLISKPLTDEKDPDLRWYSISDEDTEESLGIVHTLKHTDMICGAVNAGINRGQILEQQRICWTPLADLGLPARATNIFRLHVIATVGDLLALGPRKVFQLRGYGVKTHNLVVERLRELGVDWGIKEC